MLLHNKINMESLDMIHLNDSQIKMINLVNKKHLGVNAKSEKIAEIKQIDLPFMEKGILNYKTGVKLFSETDLLTYYHFREDESIVLCELETDGTIAYRLELREINGELNISKLDTYALRYKSELGRSTIERAYLAHLSMLVEFIKYSQLMIYLKSENKIKIKRSTISKPKGKTKHQLKKEAREQTRRKVSVSQEQRSYDYSESAREGDKRSYERHTESWETRGHWRTMKKSGKRVWINSYPKGEGARKGKDYTV